MNKLFLITILTLATIAGCKQQNKQPETPAAEVADSTEKGFPPATGLKALHRTAFVPTLENDASGDSNIIYGPALLYAWNEVRKIVEGPVTTGAGNSLDLRLLNASKSFEDALLPNEYTAEAYDADGIIARAYFKKALPFADAFQKRESALNFSGEEVVSFGIFAFDDILVKAVQILYYRDDDHFIIRLQPKDQEQEIILAKGINLQQTLGGMMEEIYALRGKGKGEAFRAGNAWKYAFVQGDQLAVPLLRFNLETNYKTLEGQQFTAGNNTHTLVTAWQRIGLVLDETGAIIEDEARMAVDSMPGESGKAHPKHLFFNQPFVLVLQRKEAQNPYFVMKVNNTSLIVKP